MLGHKSILPFTAEQYSVLHVHLSYCVQPLDIWFVCFVWVTMNNS